MSMKFTSLAHEQDNELVSADALHQCLNYLYKEALTNDFPFAAHLIGVAAEAVLEEEHFRGKKVPQQHHDLGDVKIMPFPAE